MKGKSGILFVLAALLVAGESRPDQAASRPLTDPGTDPDRFCRTVDWKDALGSGSEKTALLGPDDLPPGMRGWTAIPSVIRSDGIDTFLLEVDVNGAVNRVTITWVWDSILGPTPAPFDLHDDGLSGDRAAGDYIFTGGPFRWNTNIVPQEHYKGDLESPEGLSGGLLALMEIEETNGQVSQFLKPPEIGILRQDIPATSIQQLSPSVAISPHLVNVKTDTHLTQRYLEADSVDLSQITLPLYAVLPDKIHQLVLFSTDKVERVPVFGAYGVHTGVRADFTGTGIDPFDASAAFGSQSVLMGISALNTQSYGVRSEVLTHELTHTWARFWSLSFGLYDPASGSHWSPWSNVASQLGGYQWTANGDGSYTVHCDVGRGRNYVAPPVDRYLAGFLDASAVPPLMGYDTSSPPPWSKCATEGGHIAASEIVTTRSVADAQAIHGPRTPGPATSQKTFVLGFVAESHNRFLTPTEMTYYEILADHYTKPVPAGAPDPLQGDNWASVARYWGPGVTWRSKLYTDADHDSILDDGDGSGVDFDHPCNGSGAQNCDDNCPSVANAGQTDGDTDGAGDACDSCTDSDHDLYGDPGIPASVCNLDNCPAISNPTQANLDGDALGDACDPDADGDGYTASGSGTPSTAVAQSQLVVQGTVTGALADAQTSNDVYERIKEGKTGNVSKLEMRWTLSVPAGHLSVVHVEAHHGTSPDGDHFVFAYSANGGPYIDMFTVTKTADDGVPQYFVLPAGTAGAVTVRAMDTNRISGAPQDTLFVDRIHVVTSDPADCRDLDPGIHPGVTEGPSGAPVCSDGQDNNCDGRIDLDDARCKP